MIEARIERFLHYLAQRWQIEVEVDPPPLRDGLADAMQYLRQRNVACGIATGGSRGVASIKRALLGAQAPALLATSESGADRIGLLRHAARSFTQTDGVYVGDGPWDRDAAHAVGLGFIAVGQQAGLPGVETVLDAVHAAMD
ncbi:MAG: HAD family hydrolase [Pseudomonadota bacterium]